MPQDLQQQPSATACVENNYDNCKRLSCSKRYVKPDESRVSSHTQHMKDGVWADVGGGGGGGEGARGGGGEKKAKRLLSIVPPRRTLACCALKSCAVLHPRVKRVDNSMASDYTPHGTPAS